MLVALLAPLAHAHPVGIGNEVAIDVHLVDATDGSVHHWAEHLRYPPDLGAHPPVLTNRSYFVEVTMTKAGAPIDGVVGFRHNNTDRYVSTTAGTARFPLGHPATPALTVLVLPVPSGWTVSVWERFDWAVAPGTGALEPEPVERWGYAALSEWRTHNFTVVNGGFSKVTLGWDDVANGPGGFLALLRYTIPGGNTASYWSWTAFDGQHPARAVVAVGDVEASVAPSSPVSVVSTADGLVAQGYLPPGSVVSVTQGVLNPNEPRRFFVAAEADPGVLAAQEVARGPMKVVGWTDFRGGFQVTATVAGVGESSRSGRVAEFDLAQDGTVLLQAYVGNSLGTYAWRFAGEEVTARFARGSKVWTFGGECAGAWWMRADAGAFEDESYALLHLGGHEWPPEIAAKLTKPTGSSACMRAP